MTSKLDLGFGGGAHLPQERRQGLDRASSQLHTAQLATRPPIIICVLVLWIATIAVACGPGGENSALEGQIHEAIKRSTPGHVVDLGPVLGNDWDRLILFEGDPGPLVFNEALGFEWEGHSPAMKDGTTVVMTVGDKVIRWAYLKPVTGSSSGALTEIVFPDDRAWLEVKRGNADFVVSSLNDSGSAILCYLECPAD